MEGHPMSKLIVLVEIKNVRNLIKKKFLVFLPKMLKGGCEPPAFLLNQAIYRSEYID